MRDILRKTGIYIAYPTSSKLKSIYRPKNYKTMVNDKHTKIGIAKDCFGTRAKGYYSNFDNEVIFTPLAIIIDLNELITAEQFILTQIQSEFRRVGRAREWFDTDDHMRIKEIVAHSLSASGVSHENID